MKRFLLIILLALLPLQVYGADEYVAATEEQCQCLENAIKWEVRLNPKYVWGGSSLEVGSGKDCSGFLFAIFKRCGFLVVRTTSLMMSRGVGGWNFKPVEFKNAYALSIVWWEFKPSRPNGHVGILTEDVYNDELSMVAHASSKRGIVEQIIRVGKKANYLGRTHTLVVQVQKDAQ